MVNKCRKASVAKQAVFVPGVEGRFSECKEIMNKHMIRERKVTESVVHAGRELEYDTSVVGLLRQAARGKTGQYNERDPCLDAGIQ
jgi:hypothetical protein